jgi:glucose-1-phosphate thymidylyltransferase
MKGIILAGGLGTRLNPLTTATNKHLLPVGDKPMVLHPVAKLVDAGITEIMLVTGPEHMGAFATLLGSGKAYGCQMTYRIQDEPGGIAQALKLARAFVGQESLVVILGDNMFEDSLRGSARPAQVRHCRNRKRPSHQY